MWELNDSCPPTLGCAASPATGSEVRAVALAVAGVHRMTPEGLIPGEKNTILEESATIQTADVTS